MNILINYADKNYLPTQKVNSWTGKYIAKFDKVIEYSPEDIDGKFGDAHKEILTIKRGNGLWLWKPYIVLKTLIQAEYGDIVFYCDAGSFFIRDIQNITKFIQKKDIWISDLPLLEKQFTKMDTFILMDCLSKEYLQTNQIQGGFIAVRKTKSTIKFVEEWLEYCSNYSIISASENKLGIENDSSFISHREDQSVLSLLTKKHKIEPHTDPTQYGRLPIMYKNNQKFIYSPKFKNRKEYPVCIILHRQNKLRLKVIIKELAKTFLPVKLVYKLIKYS